MTRPAHSRSRGRRSFGRAQNDDVTDPYFEIHKPKEPAVCAHCGAYYHRGRWQWGRAPAECSRGAVCPA